MQKKPAEVWLEISRNAKTYEEWEEAAFQLDVLLGNDLWYVWGYKRDKNSMAIDTPAGARILPQSTTTTDSSTNVSNRL